MVQALEKLYVRTKIIESRDLVEIREALEANLYVPNEIVKPYVITELVSYLEKKFSNPESKICVLIGYRGEKIDGFVICQIDPYYTSYSRKCGTFGWLHADNLEICTELIKRCEKFIKHWNVRKIRGDINFPKNLGGIGVQSMGFNEKMLYGVAFLDPNSKIIEYLNSHGYQKESEYSCMYVAQKMWDKGKKIDKNIEFRYMAIEKLYGYVDEIRNLASNSFHEILPDASGRDRIYEFIDAFQKIPNSFYKINNQINFKDHSNIKQFRETWETHNLEKIEPFAPMAFDRISGELVGILLGLPDLFEAWAGNPITRCNVDTAMVKKGYFGKGIFSALNNIGQLTCNLFGVNYFEGTGIWSNNSRAIDTIFPHCKPIRKHIVLQKRLLC